MDENTRHMQSRVFLDQYLTNRKERDFEAQLLEPGQRVVQMDDVSNALETTIDGHSLRSKFTPAWT